MKSKFFTLLTLLLCLCSSGAWATEETITLSGFTLTDGKATLTSASGNASVTVNTAENIKNNVSRGIRWLNENNYIKVVVNEGFRIKSVKLTSGSQGNSPTDITYTLTDGSASLAGSWDHTPNSGKQASYTWTASDGTFYNTWYLNKTNSSGDIYIQSVTVNYEVSLVENAAPTILTQPVSSLTAYVGFETSLSVAASGYPTPTYQWYRCTNTERANEEIIPGATDGTFTFTPDAEGTFYFFVKATNNFDDVDHVAISNVATVTVETKYCVQYDKGISGATFSNPLALAYYKAGTAITLPTNRYFYKDGQSVTKWSDGTNEYALGASYTVNSNVTFYPVFAENTKTPASEATTITWTFATSNGAPGYALESDGGTTSVIATTANGIDLKMGVQTMKVGDNRGKFNNGSYADKAQVNKYTYFTIPAVKGMTVKYIGTNGTAAVDDNILFGESKENATSVTGATYTYVYTGTASTLTIADEKGGLYPSGISVVYPTGEPTAPVTFENKEITVTFPSGTPSYSEATEAITVSGAAKSGADAIKTDDNLSIVVKIPTAATAATITLCTNGENSSYNFNGEATSPAWSDWDGITNGKQSTIDIISYKGSTLTITKKSGTKELYRVVLAYAIGTEGQITLTIDPDMEGWRTFYDATKDYQVDEDTKIYVVKEQNETPGVVTLSQIEGKKIKADTPVILKNASNSITLTETTGAVALAANLLAVTTGTAVDGYRLGYGDDGVRFYRYTASSPAAGIVYIPLTYVTTGGDAARSLTFDFDDDELTGIKSIESSKLQTAGEYYDLSGRRVVQPTKGLYIVNGKKVVIK